MHLYLKRSRLFNNNLFKEAVNLASSFYQSFFHLAPDEHEAAFWCGATGTRGQQGRLSKLLSELFLDFLFSIEWKRISSWIVRKWFENLEGRQFRFQEHYSLFRCHRGACLLLAVKKCGSSETMCRTSLGVPAACGKISTKVYVLERAQKCVYEN